jgi:thymidylate synthase (FAD)
MLEIKFLIKLPIFVARQHIRHRMSSTNEKSARYSILEKEFYIPAPEQMAVQSTTNKQGRGDTLPLNQAHRIMKMLKHDAETNYAHYEEILNETIDDSGNAHPIYEDRDGLARELARMNLTLNYYTTMVWKIDLHNLLHYLSLRADPHAQWEIRQYALKMCEVIQDWVPHVYEAFLDYRLFGATLSQQEIRVIRYIVNALESPATLDSLDYGNASKREIEAFKQLIGITK